MTTTESSDEFTPATTDEARDFLTENASGAGRAIFPVGGRTALHYGYAPTQPGFTFSTLRLNRTIDYPARDMTITVEAGIRMDELTEILKAEGQRLPIDVPQSSRATLGGVLATNTSGPRRLGFGTLRDYLIGITSIDAAGKTFSAGGRVVKNVAGYDLCKLMIGSLGSLAVITQVTLKVKPQPESSKLLWCAAADWQAVEAALENLLTSATRPVALEVLNAAAAHEISAEARLDLPAGGPVLCIGFEGAARETEWQTEAMTAELQAAGIRDVAVVDDAEPLWFVLTDFATSSDEPLTFQANLRPSRLVEFSELATSAGVSLTAHAGNGIVIGHLPDEVTTLDAAVKMLAPLQALAYEADGNLVIFDCDETWKQTIPVFGQARQDRALMQRIKQQLDPRDILNPGRVFSKDAISAVH